MKEDNTIDLAVKSGDDKGQKWIKRLTILVAIWGILNLLFSSIVFGVIFILFAALIWGYKSFIAIYALGVVLWVLALIQIQNASGILKVGFTDGPAQGTELILIAIANFAIGALIIYRTRKLEKLG
jgi:hypothetical protein